MMISEHFLNKRTAEKMRNWRHSGFSVHQSFPTASNDKQGKEKLAQYIARAPLSNEKIKYDPQKEIVLYKSKMDKNSKRNF